MFINCFFQFVYNIIIMIQTLEKYILQDSQQPLDVDKLIQQSEKIKSNIAGLEKKLDKIAIKKYQNLKGSQKLDKILSIMKRSDKQLSLQKQALQAQSSQINNLANYITKYIAQQGNQPRVLQQKLKAINSLVKQAEQNNYPTAQIQKMKEWNHKLVANLQKKLCDLVCAFPTHVRIKLDDIRSCYDLLNEDICRQFVRTLYKGIIEYDVPTFSYVLLATKEGFAQNGIVTAERQTVVFTGEKAQQNYSQIQSSIINTQKLALTICEPFKQNQKYTSSTKQEIKNCKQNIKAQVEYILPYLSLQKRKKIIQLLVTKSETETTLYDILVRLRLKGQDGDMMESNIKQLIQKIKLENKLVDEVIVFLEICGSQQKSLNIGFFVCNQLLNRLEGFIQYSEIEKLLNLREQMRFKIHHPA